MKRQNEFKKNSRSAGRTTRVAKQAKSSGCGGALLTGACALICFAIALSSLVQGIYLATLFFTLSGIASLSPAWSDLSGRGPKVPNPLRIGAILVFFVAGAMQLPINYSELGERHATPELNNPTAIAAELLRLQAKINPDAVSVMDYSDPDYREAYPELRREHYEQSNEMMPWAAVAAAESKRCSQIYLVNPSLRGTPKTLSWEVTCMDSEGYQDTFDILPDQATAIRNKYAPDTTAEAREAAMQLAVAEPRSARWKDFDEAVAVRACGDLVQISMVNQGSFDAAWGWDIRKNDATGVVTIQQDFEAQNGFGGTISSKYHCEIDTSQGGRVTALKIMEAYGWRSLL